MAAFYASASTGLAAYASLKGRAQADKTWPHLLEWNEKAFGAWAQVHAAAEHAEAFEYGAQVSRLSSALDVLEAVAKGSKAAAGLTAEAKVTFNEALAAVKPMQQAACRHNDAVYHERVPPLAALDAVEQHGGSGGPGGATARHARLWGWHGLALGGARHSTGAGVPLGAQSGAEVRAPASAKVADSAAFHHPDRGQVHRQGVAGGRASGVSGVGRGVGGGAAGGGRQPLQPARTAQRAAGRLGVHRAARRPLARPLRAVRHRSAGGSALVAQPPAWLNLRARPASLRAYLVLHPGTLLGPLRTLRRHRASHPRAP